MENNDNLVGVLKTLAKWRKVIFRTCLVVLIGSIVISLLLPVFYKASTIFYAASPDLVNPDKMFGGGNTDMRYYGTGEDMDRLMTVAQGGELVDHLVRKFNLYEHYDIDSANAKGRFKVAEHFHDLYTVQKTKYDAIELSVEDKDRELAAAIANEARAKIAEITLKMIKESQRQQVETYEENIEKNEIFLRELGDSLTHLREKYGIYYPGAQAEVLATQLSDAQSSVSGLKGKLEFMESSPHTRRDSVLKIKANLKGAEAQLQNISESIQSFNEGLSKVEVLTDQHEKSKLQLNWDKERAKRLKVAYNSSPPVLHLVEEAQVPVVKSRPVRSIIVLASVAIAFIFTVIGVLIFDQYKDFNWQEIKEAQRENGRKSSKARHEKTLD